ncbi:MAG TPA: lantibiotic dehydratase [Streptosporangiaceae bacterium]|nr:lantibiotic dehydratase [Streptosporangiaceae bacterium]
MLSGLRLVANDLCSVRGERLVLPMVPGGEPRRLADEEQTVRWTGAVRMAMDAARTPIRYADLADRLSGAFPETSASVVEQMLLGLIDGEFLLTDLRPPTTEADLVSYVLGKLSRVDQHVRGGTAEPGGSSLKRNRMPSIPPARRRPCSRRARRSISECAGRPDRLARRGVDDDVRVVLDREIGSKFCHVISPVITHERNAA